MPEFPRKFPRRGEIYWAPMDKVRPVVIVSNDTGNQHSNSVVVVPITTQIREKRYPVDVHLDDGDPLPGECRITCNSLYTLLKDDLHEYRASLRPEQITEVDAALKVGLALK